MNEYSETQVPSECMSSVNSSHPLPSDQPPSYQLINTSGNEGEYDIIARATVIPAAPRNAVVKVNQDSVAYVKPKLDTSAVSSPPTEDDPVEYSEVNKTLGVKVRL